MKMKMMLRLRKSIPIPRNSLLLPLHFTSLASSEAHDPAPKSSFITDYLISSCGFSPDKAAKASPSISHITSPSRPDSVTHFFKHLGFADPDIRQLISGAPGILYSDVALTLEPNLRALRKLGFADADLRKLIVRNPKALLLRSAVSRIEFWKTLLNGNTEKVLRVFARNPGIVNHDIGKSISPKIDLLKKHGLSDADIQMMATARWVFLRSSASIGALIEKAKKLGFRPDSPTFRQALVCLCNMRDGKIEERADLFKSVAWSEEEFHSVLLKWPCIMHYSEENVLKKMEFFVGSVGCTPSYISSNPVLLGLSLEKRLIPRHNVIKILKPGEGVRKGWDISRLMKLSEKDFVEKVVLRYGVAVPKLLENYVAASAGKALL